MYMLHDQRAFTAAAYEYLFIAVVVGFHFDVIDCKRGAAEASGSGEVQRVWAWPV